MILTLIVAAFTLGFAGGAHCLAMCGGPCAAFSKGNKADAKVHRFAALGLHAGRIGAYVVLGAFAGGLVQGVAWASQFVAVFKPLWAMLHALMLVWGLILLIYATQPTWASRVTAPLQRRIVWANQSPWRSSFIGFHWLVLPCGLLYSALLLAGLSSSAWQGAAVMLAFVLPTVGWLASVHWLVRLRSIQSAVLQSHMRRLVGLMLALGSSWSLWHHASQGFKALC